MNDPHGDAGATTFTASHDGACDDVQLSRRIGLVTSVRRAGVGREVPAVPAASGVTGLALLA